MGFDEPAPITAIWRGIGACLPPKGSCWAHGASSMPAVAEQGDEGFHGCPDIFIGYSQLLAGREPAPFVTPIQTKDALDSD